MTNIQNSQAPEAPKPPVVSLEQSAADMVQCREKLLQESPGTAEHRKAAINYNRSGERFVETCRRTTSYEHKFKPHYNLSSGQITEAKNEYKSVMDERIIKAATTTTTSYNVNLNHYINAIAGYASIDACREIAKGRVFKKKLCFLEKSSDAPVRTNSEDSESILDGLVEIERNDDLFLHEIREVSRTITPRTRPDINLWDILELILQDYSMREIGLKLNVNPDTLSSFIRSNRVKRCMKPFLTLSLLMFLFIATECC